MSSNSIKELKEFEVEMTSIKINEADIPTLYRFFSIFNHMNAGIKQEYKSNIAYILIDILRKMDKTFVSEYKENEITVISEIITSVGVMVSGISEESESSDVLIYFLHSLKNKEFSKISSALYGKLSDVINDISWVFKLVQKEESVFPIHELIVKVTEDFYYSNENLLHLTMALQIFKNIDEKFQDSESEAKIKEIAQSYNIGILECIIAKGELFDINTQNYSFNSTLIAKNEKYIIIRNKSKIYFNGFDEEVLSEINENGEELCYFVKITIEDNWYFTSFEEYMFMASPEDKRKFLSYIIKNGIYNFLFDKAIVVDINTNNFVRLTNGSNNDIRICCNHKSYENNFSGFYEVVSNNHLKDIRTSIIFGSKRNCDIVTFDFILAFYKFFEVDTLKYDLLLNVKKENQLTYQNSIIRSFFEHIIDNYDLTTFCKVYENYYSFIKNHFDFNINSKIKDVKHLIYPFVPYQPFESEEDIIKWIDDKNEYSNSYQIEKIEVKDTRKGQQRLTKDGTDITAYEIDNETSLVSESGNVYVIINHMSSTIQFDERINGILKIASKLITFIDFIKDNDTCKINQKLHQIVELIKGTKISNENFKKFNIYRADSEDILCVFKLLWHFVIYNINDEKINDFYKLIFECHHTDSILMEKDWVEFFESVEQLSSDKGTLLIAKESSGDSGTLFLTYSKYHQDNAASKRGELFKIFDINTLQNEIQLNKDDQYTYCGTIINKIIFVTDNITKGAATTQLLKYHLTGEKDDTKKNFLELPDNKNIKAIVNKNNILNSNIEVYTLYCLDTTKELSFDCKNTYKIHCLKSISSKYILDDEISKIYESVYNYKPNTQIGNVCMIRNNNMPHKTIFDAKTKDTLRLSGIFNRKNELT